MFSLKLFEAIRTQEAIDQNFRYTSINVFLVTGKSNITVLNIQRIYYVSI